MLKRAFLLIAMITGFSFVVSAQVGPRHYENGGRYSICPPATWRVQSFAPSPNKIFVGPVENNHTTLMVFTNHRSGLNENETFSEYVLSISFIHSLTLKNYKYNNVSVFVTDNGLEGLKLDYTYEQDNNDIQAYSYFFIFPDGRIIDITCGNARISGNKFEKQFDESAKTLEPIN